MSAPMVNVAFEESSSNASSDEAESEFEQEENADNDIKVGSEEKAGLADVLAKILTKKTQDKNVILSKGKSDRLLQKARLKKKAEEGGTVEEDTELKSNVEKRQKKQLWEGMGRNKPDITKKEKERNLQRIATRGVVQLFNAVKKQQKLIEDKVKEAGTSSKKSKVLSSMTKGAFLDVLKNTNTSGTDEKNTQQSNKTFSKVNLKEGDDKPTWSVLRDDFMMGAKMKDWDKNSDSDSGNEGHESDISMSDG